MPYVEARATSSAKPEVVFEHLAVAEAWSAWGRFPMKASQARPGDETRNGVGAIKSVWPVREQTVVYHPPRHFAYVALRGMPVRRYRSDVYLEPSAGGTNLHWRAEFEPLVPGLGAPTRAMVGAMIRMFARQLARHSERCRPGCPGHVQDLPSAR